MWIKLTFPPKLNTKSNIIQQNILYTHSGSGLTRLARGTSETLRTLMDNNNNNNILTQYLFVFIHLS